MGFFGLFYFFDFNKNFNIKLNRQRKNINKYLLFMVKRDSFDNSFLKKLHWFCSVDSKTNSKYERFLKFILWVVGFFHFILENNESLKSVIEPLLKVMKALEGFLCSWEPFANFFESQLNSSNYFNFLVIKMVPSINLWV